MSQSLFDGYHPDFTVDELISSNENLRSANMLNLGLDKILTAITNNSDGDVFNEVDRILARTNLSITNFIKKLMIMSRVFIQNSIVDDPSLNDNLNTIQNQYLAFILAALSLNEDIGNNRTIKKQIEIVATENYHSLEDIFTSVGMEAKNNNDKTYQSDVGYGTHGQYKYKDWDLYSEDELDQIAKDDPDFYEELMDHKEEDLRKLDRSRANDEEERERQKEIRRAEQDEEYEKNRERRNKERIDKYNDDKEFEAFIQENKELAEAAAKKKAETERKEKEIANRRENFKKAGDKQEILKDTRSLSLASGRIVEVTIGGKRVSIPVQLIPMIIPDDVAEKFISLNFQLSWRQRLIQAKAGEISWIKDLLFNMDQVEAVQDALKKDTTGVLYEMKQRQKNAAREATKKIIANNNKQNIANAIFIFEKQSFLRNAKARGLNWRNPKHRDRFFNYTFSFMCVLIDPIYAKSEYYWAGIDAVGEYSAKALKNSNEKDSYNLKDIMTAFTQGHSPKFI